MAMSDTQEPKEKSKNSIGANIKSNLPLIIVAVLVVTGFAACFYSINKTNNLAKSNEQAIAKLGEQVNKLADPKPAESAEQKPSDTSSLELVGTPTGFHLDTTSVGYVNNVYYWDKDSRGYNTLYIDVTIVNSGTKDDNIGPYSFKLKDSGNTTFEPYTEPMFERIELKGKQTLVGQTISPKEKVSGTIAFKVPADLRSAKLWLNGKAYDVKII